MEEETMELIGQVIQDITSRKYKPFYWDGRNFHYVDNEKGIDLQMVLGNGNYYIRDNSKNRTYISTRKNLENLLSIQQILIQDSEKRQYITYFSKEDMLGLIKIISKTKEGKIICNNPDAISNIKNDEDFAKYAEDFFREVYSGYGDEYDDEQDIDEEDYGDIALYDENEDEDLYEEDVEEELYESNNDDENTDEVSYKTDYNKYFYRSNDYERFYEESENADLYEEGKYEECEDYIKYGNVTADNIENFMENQQKDNGINDKDDNEEDDDTSYVYEDDRFTRSIFEHGFSNEPDESWLYEDDEDYEYDEEELEEGSYKNNFVVIRDGKELDGRGKLEKIYKCETEIIKRHYNLEEVEMFAENLRLALEDLKRDIEAER